MKNQINVTFVGDSRLLEIAPFWHFISGVMHAVWLPYTDLLRMPLPFGRDKFFQSDSHGKRGTVPEALNRFTDRAGRPGYWRLQGIERTQRLRGIFTSTIEKGPTAEFSDTTPAHLARRRLLARAVDVRRPAAGRDALAYVRQQFFRPSYERRLDLVERAAKDPEIKLPGDLIGSVQEALRLHRTGNPARLRRAAADALKSGLTFKAGDRVTLYIGKANLDQAMFGPDAGEFNPRRETSKGIRPFGLGFGGGPHVCIDRPLLVYEQGSPIRLGAQARMLMHQLSPPTRPPTHLFANENRPCR